MIFENFRSCQISTIANESIPNLAALRWDIQEKLRDKVKTKLRDYLGIFPNMRGGGLLNSQNFCKFTKSFLVCQNHSEVLKHVLQSKNFKITANSQVKTKNVPDVQKYKITLFFHKQRVPKWGEAHFPVFFGQRPLATGRHI